MRAPDNFPILQDGGGIAEGASGTFGIFVNKTNAERNGADAFGGFGERGKIGVNEIGAQQQIARRIAAQKQLRRDDEFRAERAGLFITGGKLLPVGCKVADGRIELENANFHHVESSRNRRFRNEFTCGAGAPGFSSAVGRAPESRTRNGSKPAVEWPSCARRSISRT